MEKDPFQKRLEITNWILLAAMAFSGFVLTATRFSLGIVFGGLLSVINFHWLCRDLSNLFTKNPTGAKKGILLRYALRLGMNALLLFWMISDDVVDIIGLLIGLSVVPLNIILTTLLFLMKKNPIEGVR
jgi:hypothetical protein